MQIQLEIIISQIKNNYVNYKIEYVGLTSQDPDTTVLETLDKGGQDNYLNYIIHSTSWRYKSNQIILTYLVLLPTSDQLSLTKELDLQTIQNNKVTHSYKPGAQNLPIENVIKHAFEHLAFLIHHKKQSIYVEKLDGTQIAFLKKLHEDVAGEIK